MKFKKQIARSTMNKLKKRTFTLLTALSMLFVSIPVYAESPTVETETPKEYIAPKGGCMAVENDLYCMFTFDINEMQHYKEPTIPLDFKIQGIKETEEITITVTGTIPIEYNQSKLQVYNSVNNEVSLRITLLESQRKQNVETLDYEHITIMLQNVEGKNVYTIEATLINTQHGYFVSYVNEDLLFMHYLQWLKNNKYISTGEYNKIDAEHHTLKDTTSAFSSYSTTSDTTKASNDLDSSTVQVDYSIRTYDSGETLYIDGYVYWGGNLNNKMPARYIEIELCDEDINYISLALTNTNANGYFYFRIENDTGIFENGYDIRIKVKAKSPYAYILYMQPTEQNIAPTTCLYVDCGDNIKSNILNKTYKSERTSASESFYILDSFIVASNYVKAMSGETMPCVKVIYPISNNTSNYFYPGLGININPLSQESWDIILHEYGHFVANHFDITPLLAINHTTSQNLISFLATDNGIETILSGDPKKDGCKLAWQEGWAHYFSISAQVHQNADDLGLNGVGNASFEGYHIENIDNTTSKGEGHELAVARALWDMADVHNSTEGATDNDPINWGFFKVWNYSIDSDAQTFSDFVQYAYGLISNTSVTFKNIGYILGTHRISADLISIPTTQYSAYFTMRPAYSDTYVLNTCYLEIYNLNMQRIYQFNIASDAYTYEINSGLWQSLCSQYSDGLYIALRTVPEEGGYATGPYYSEIKLFVP